MALSPTKVQPNKGYMRQNFYHRTTYSIEANFCMGIMGSMFIQWILNTFSVGQDRILNGRHKQRKWVDVVIFMVDVFKTILSDLERSHARPATAYWMWYKGLGLPIRGQLSPFINEKDTFHLPTLLVIVERASKKERDLLLNGVFLHYWLGDMLHHLWFISRINFNFINIFLSNNSIHSNLL